MSKAHAQSSNARPLVLATTVSFATFGSFWGAWGASIPRVRDQAGVSEGQLGLALLFVGVGALPAMLLVGRLVDRFGLRLAAYLIAGLGLTSIGMVLAAHGFVSLAVGLLLVGMTSGGADVAMNSVAGRAERDAGRPIITRAHGMLSAFVVLGSLGAGAVAGADLPVATPFVFVTVLALLSSVAMLRALPREPRRASAAERAAATHDDGSGLRLLGTVPLLAIGVLGALAFASESAHQNWSAIFGRDVLDLGQGRAALAPALFAIVVSVTRLSVGRLGSTHAGRVLFGGGVLAAVGSAIVATAPGQGVFALGLVVAAAGTGVLFPTVLGIVSRAVPETQRGRATSLVTTVSYVGFLLGPAYVGGWADAFDMRVAMFAVSALALSLALLTPVLLRVAALDRPILS